MTKPAKAIASENIPVIDISPLLVADGESAARLKAARQLAWAATEVGFIYVRNHGINADLLARARAVGLDFFRQPLARKLEVASNIHHHGYLRPGATKMYDDAAVDLKESFNFGVELPAAELAAATTCLLGPNRWPRFMPALRTAIYPYYEAASRCARALLEGFALAGGHPADVFTRLSDRPVSRGSLQYYPPRPGDLPPDRYSLAPHTDFGVLTVLAQDALGGLEIQGLDGEWIAAPPIPGTLVVNVGDLLGRWSNDTYRSTPHRVINTSGQERLSLVLAYDPNAETVVDAGLFCAPGETPRYEPITCGDYLQWRFAKAFDYRSKR
ncbi:MAG: 2OG-Fe(II) oxygenase [Gammaproteobacteria bacterium]|nr:2OG-Fe(II) oxygenase [Gammaproteobacteria bacterium]